MTCDLFDIEILLRERTCAIWTFAGGTAMISGRIWNWPFRRTAPPRLTGDPAGYLVRFDGATAGEVVRRDLTIPNSVGWSPDGRTMYFTHTTANTILAWDYAPGDGGLSRERVLYRHDGPGGLDGFRVDVEGNIWHAVYGEARVIKISTAGRVLGEVRLPTRNITCPEFVGTELFITTAADEEGEGGAQSREFGGGLYRIDVGVGGVPAYPFKPAA